MDVQVVFPWLGTKRGFLGCFALWGTWYPQEAKAFRSLEAASSNRAMRACAQEGSAHTARVERGSAVCVQNVFCSPATSLIPARQQPWVCVRLSAPARPAHAWFPSKPRGNDCPWGLVLCPPSPSLFWNPIRCASVLKMKTMWICLEKEPALIVSL